MPVCFSERIFYTSNNTFADSVLTIEKKKSDAS